MNGADDPTVNQSCLELYGKIQREGTKEGTGRNCGCSQPKKIVEKFEVIFVFLSCYLAHKEMENKRESRTAK